MVDQNIMILKKNERTTAMYLNCLLKTPRDHNIIIVTNNINK